MIHPSKRTIGLGLAGAALALTINACSSSAEEPATSLDAGSASSSGQQATSSGGGSSTSSGAPSSSSSSGGSSSGSGELTGDSGADGGGSCTAINLNGAWGYVGDDTKLWGGPYAPAPAGTTKSSLLLSFETAATPGQYELVEGSGVVFVAYAQTGPDIRYWFARSGGVAVASVSAETGLLVADFNNVRFEEGTATEDGPFVPTPGGSCLTLATGHAEAPAEP